MTLDEVDLQNLLLDAVEDARARKADADDWTIHGESS